MRSLRLALILFGTSSVLSWSASASPDALQAATSTTAQIATTTTAATRATVEIHAATSTAAATASPRPTADGTEDRAAAELASKSDVRTTYLTMERWGLRFELPILVAGVGELASAVPVDSAGNQFDAGVALAPVVRLGLRVSTPKPLGDGILLFAEYEHDLPTGTWTSETPVPGEGMPASTPTTTLRKAWGRVSLGPYLHVGGGFMTSHFGLGLVANDGTHSWAAVADPRRGDVMLRGFVATGPLTSSRIFATLAIDSVRHDESLLEGDSAYQLVASAIIGRDRPNEAGFFIARRHQTSSDGRTLDVTLFDLAGRTETKLGDVELRLEAEGAAIVGDTTLGASRESPTNDVLQLGGALRGTVGLGTFGGTLELAFASGDDNTHDPKANGFHADPAFDTGLLLFRWLEGAQTGRGYGTAADPQLTGAPPTGIERFPTRGSMTNAFVVFPRLWARPIAGLDGYAGVLFARAPELVIDPFNTDLAGGSPRNALGGKPGNYLGTEIDVGLRYRLALDPSEVVFGAEGGVLLPGSAFQDANGSTPGAVYGGRVLVAYRL